MPTLIAEAKEHCAEPLEEFREQMTEVMDEARKKGRVLMRRSRVAAEELKHETERELRKHPITAVGTAFGVGFAGGMLALWLIRRR